MTISAGLSKRPVRRHEAHQHGDYELGGIADWLSALGTHRFGIGNKIAVHGCGQFDAYFYRLIIRKRFNL